MRRDAGETMEDGVGDDIVEFGGFKYLAGLEDGCIAGCDDSNEWLQEERDWIVPGGDV